MFDRAIIDNDKFMDLSMSAKALYFLMGMEADDEGFVSPKKIIRLYGGNTDDVKALIFKNFIIPFESGVVVITDWNQNNWLDNRRIKETEYQEEKKLLALDKRKRYMLSNGSAPAKQALSNGSASIEENSIVESRTEENRREETQEQPRLAVAQDAPSREIKKEVKGNADVNLVLSYFSEFTGLIKFDGTIKENRRYAYLALQKFGSPQNVGKLIQLAVQDEFHRKNLTSIKYLYYNGVKFLAAARESKINPKVQIPWATK